MSFPSIFAILSAHCPARPSLGRLAALALALAGLPGSSLAQAASYRFDGNPVADCPLAGKIYTCASAAWLGDRDELVISAGYTLAFSGDLSLGLNQGLAMAAGARLAVAGKLDIRDVKPANLQVDGGNLEVGGSFSMGGQKQTLSADVSANAIHLGPERITINGKLSAAVITTASALTINGDVRATQSFSLASGGKVFGNVDTGSLVLEASGALVRGSAWVDTALLEWHGRVDGTIYCRQGSAGTNCGCVTNNSGYAVSSANGPRCEGPAPAGVHHYRITHDGQASSCAGEDVTVTACANADCSAPHVASAPGVTLVPGGAAVSFGSSGVAQASVTSIQSGSVTLGFVESVPAACLHTGAGSASCAMHFSGQTAFELIVPHHRVGELQAPTLQALQPAANRKSCDPVFKDRTVKVDFSCAHVKPASGRDHLHLGVRGSLSETASAPLACSGMAASTAPTVKQLDVSFDAEGKGSVDLRYADVGSVRLKASVSRDGARIEGEGEFTVAPWRIGLAATAPAGGFVAGVPFELKLASLNKAGGVTRAFDKGLLPDAPGVVLGSCAIAPLRPGGVNPSAFAGFTDGVATLALSWSEVGSMGLSASLADFLGSGIGSSGSTGDCKSLGPFAPAYLQVDRDAASPVRNFDYSSEPIQVVVSARNGAGEITRNYEHATGRSEDVTLAALVGAGGPGAWAAGPAGIPAASFTEGKAAWSRAWVVGKDVGPASITLRATSASASSQDKGENLTTEVRLGRLRLGSRFGGHKATLSMPVTAEYWTGKSWLLNSDDSHTLVPQAAFAFKGAAGMKPAPAFGAGPLKLAHGAAAFGLALGEGGPGPVDIAINLRSGTQDDACIGNSAGTGIATAGAAIPWLRPFTTGCNAAQARDPYGRATFGVPTPENRRIIHVREVFN